MPVSKVSRGHANSTRNRETRIEAGFTVSDFSFRVIKIDRLISANPTSIPTFGFLIDRALTISVMTNNIYTYIYIYIYIHIYISIYIYISPYIYISVKCSIDDSGTNLSDHSAMLLSIKMSDPHSIKHTLPSKPAVHTRLRWDKATVA